MARENENADSAGQLDIIARYDHEESVSLTWKAVAVFVLILVCSVALLRWI